MEITGRFLFCLPDFLAHSGYLLWIKTYRKPELHPKLSKEELTYINSDSEEETAEKIPWLKLLPKKRDMGFRPDNNNRRCVVVLSLLGSKVSC